VFLPPRGAKIGTGKAGRGEEKRSKLEFADVPEVERLAGGSLSMVAGWFACWEKKKKGEEVRVLGSFRY
jgi:hypothetical protein